MNNKFLKYEGFTLIEVMVALAVVSGLLIVLIASMNYHLEVLTNQKNKILLTYLAKEKLDNLKVNRKEEKGEFREPFKWVTFQTEIKDSIYPDIKEFTVRVKGSKDEIVLTELLISPTKQ